MVNRVITATDANRNLSDLLNKVHYQHQSFDIKRGKEVIARIVPVPASKMPISDLNHFFKNLPGLDEQDKVDFEKTLNDIRSLKPEIDSWD